MRDPHVVALHYRLETGRPLAFNDPIPLEKETDAFSLRLANGELRVEMKDHFPTADAARLEVEPYLRSWEIATDLKHGPGAIRFRFERPEIIDRDPPPPGAYVAVQLESVSCVATADSVSVLLTYRQYPDPPDKFEASPDVVAMWERYEGYLAGKEPLPGMAQYCLTVVEQSAGGHQARRRAAQQYAIDYDVLSRLGHLASKVGDARTVRKRVPGQTLRPHTPAEIVWMEAVIKRIIERVGEWAADPNEKWPQITMEELPRL